MKISKIWAAAFAVAAMTTVASCSSDEPVNTGGETAAESYIRVQLANTPDFGGRADIFDAGSSDERKINNIAFYFFYADGTPFKMENNNISGEFYASNYVKPLMDLSVDNGVLASTLVLGKAVNEGWKGTVPSRMVAVANIGSESYYQSLANKTLTQLQAELRDAKNSAPARGEFIMTTSTYDSNGVNVFWSEISLENVKTTPIEAVQHPVTVYLERLAAKVTVTDNPLAPGYLTGGYYKVATRPILDANGNQIETDLYAHITGWDLNATPTKSYLFKNIDSANVPFTDWNRPLLSRCFWATTPSENLAADGLHKSFNWASLSNSFGDVDYCYENTLQPKVGKVQDASSNATKVLLQATITDRDGNALDLVSWAGTLYTTAEFKKMVLAFKGGSKPSDVTFKRNVKGNGIHYVSTYYQGDKVDEFDNVRVWDKGVCYYIVNIRHAVNAEGNVYGVVRNHTYNVNINSISGLGTPGGPGDHPEPENPDPESESFVAATVQVLSWHVIDFSVDVES